MHTGVSTASLFLRKNNEEALPLLQELGVRRAEVFLTTFSEYDESFARGLKASAPEMDINSVHVLNTQFEPQLFNKHPRVQADAFSWLEKVLAAANALDAPYYTFHGAARIKRDARTGEKDDFVAMAQGFAGVAKRCLAHGVTLCLENVEWSTYNRVGVFSRLEHNVPSLRGVLDIKQARLTQTPYQHYLAEMGEKLAYVHVSDVDEQGRICLPGRGVFDFEMLIKRLKDVGFDGTLFIEVYTGDYAEETQLKTACAYLDEILYKYGCDH